MGCRHPDLSVAVGENFVGPSIYNVATVGITENTLEDTDPSRQAVSELGHQRCVLDSQQEINVIPSYRKGENYLRWHN